MLFFLLCSANPNYFDFHHDDWLACPCVTACERLLAQPVIISGLRRRDCGAPNYLPTNNSGDTNCASVDPIVVVVEAQRLGP